MTVCMQCGRKLKSDISKQSGYGPVCYRKVFGGSAKIRDGDRKPGCSDGEIPYYEIPGQMVLEDFLNSEDSE